MNSWDMPDILGLWISTLCHAYTATSILFFFVLEGDYLQSSHNKRFGFKSQYETNANIHSDAYTDIIISTLGNPVLVYSTQIQQSTWATALCMMFQLCGKGWYLNCCFTIISVQNDTSSVKAYPPYSSTISALSLDSKFFCLPLWLQYLKSL